MPLPRTKEDWKVIAKQFQDQWNVFHTLGALDSKHIAIKKPPKFSSIYLNYKGHFSMVLVALVEAEYKSIWKDTDGGGHQSNGQLFADPNLKE